MGHIPEEGIKTRENRVKASGNVDITLDLDEEGMRLGPSEETGVRCYLP